MEIYDTNNTFEFSKIQLTKPTISNGGYFIKFLVDSNPLYIQPPKCKTRQGIIRAGKRLYCDLMFTNDNEDFIQWMENLESHCQQTIFKNREKWFDGDMELHDIENYFTSTLKIFKSGKFYVVRTNLSTVLGKPILKIYDEDENEVDFETISDDTGVMTILEVQGIKCSSKSFQIEIEMKQLMVLRPANIFEKCIIKSSSSGAIVDSSKKIEESPEQDIKVSMQSIEPIKDSLETDKETDIVISAEPTESSEPNEEPKFVEPLDIDTAETAENNIEVKIDDDTIKETTVNDNKNPTVGITGENLEEIDFHLEELKDDEPILIKKRNNIYYDMYKEAKRKARIARDLALSAYLEAKRIKNTYMLDEIDDDDDDEYDDDFENSSDEEEDDDDKDNENGEKNNK